MNPMLKVTEQGQTRWVTGEPTQPTSAMVKIDPDTVVRSAIDAQSSIVRDYMRNVGSAAQRTVDAGPQRSPTGYSNESELKARNTRFFFTVGAYVALAGAVAWGIVSLATLADVIADGWHWPMWLAATGALALWLVKMTHAMESERTPEGIELERVRSDGYATERAADGQHAIATAVAEAISWRAQSEYADSQARQLATEEAYGRILPQPARQLTDGRRFAVKWQPDTDVTYAAELPLQSPTAPQRSVSIVCGPATPNTACLALCEAVGRLYDDCAQRGDDLVTTRLPWSQRGDWAAQQKRIAADVLAQLDPPLLLAGDGGRWRLNRAAWPHPLALSAIRRRWPRD